MLWRLSGGSLETPWKLSGDSLEALWRLSGDSLETLWRLSGGSLEILWRLSGGSLEALWRLSGYSLETLSRLAGRLSEGSLETLWRLSGGSLETLWRLSGGFLEIFWGRQNVGFSIVLQAFVAVTDRQTTARQGPKESSEERKSWFFNGFTSISSRDGSWDSRETPTRHPRDTRGTARDKPAPRLPVEAFLLVLLLFKSLTTTRTLKSHDC